MQISSNIIDTYFTIYDNNNFLNTEIICTILNHNNKYYIIKKTYESIVFNMTFTHITINDTDYKYIIFNNRVELDDFLDSYKYIDFIIINSNGKIDEFIKKKMFKAKIIDVANFKIKQPIKKMSFDRISSLDIISSVHTSTTTSPNSNNCEWPVTPKVTNIINL